MRSFLPPLTVFAGLLAAFVGFASSFAVVLRGLAAAGASPAEAASGLMALCVAQGFCALWLSARTRMPISMAWSTPGAALLAASGAVEGGFPVAVGAFLLAAVLVVVAGWWRPLGRAVATIPASLANAMLAGVLMNLCLAPVRGVAQSPGPALAIVATWAVVGRVHRLLAVPAAVAVTVILIALQPGAAPATSALPHPVLVWPVFTFAALIGVAVPLFIVTMASQNIPGIAVLSVNGFRPEPGPLFCATGIFSVLAAPLGGHAVNLAAITAAICAGPDAHPDPAQRWKAVAVSGAAYVTLGPLAAAATRFVGAAPLLIETVAGLALLGALGGALHGAVVVPLTGVRALSAEAPEGRPDWLVAFLEALASEAADYMEMLRSLEHSWIIARARVPAQRSTSRASLAIDVIAAAPLISATTLAGAIGMSIKSATELLDRFVGDGAAVEVTHRSARRLFGLAGMAPLREVTTPPRRPLPGRGRGRPRSEPEDLIQATAAPQPLPPATRFERPRIDYAALETAMAHCDQVIRQSRARLQSVSSGSGPSETTIAMPG